VLVGRVALIEIVEGVVAPGCARASSSTTGRLDIKISRLGAPDYPMALQPLD
jgi:hypothetical protein